MNLGNLDDYFIILMVFLLMFNNKRWCNTILYSTTAFFSLLKINLSNSGAIVLFVVRNLQTKNLAKRGYKPLNLNFILL